MVSKGNFRYYCGCSVIVDLNQGVSVRNSRAYYSATINDFLHQETNAILGTMYSNDSSAETTIQQRNSWEQEIEILKDQLANLGDGRVMFEYTIPRMGKRVDVIVLYKNIVFLLEFKCGETAYKASACDQVYDYALDLRNFQKESCDKLLVAMVVSTGAKNMPCDIHPVDRIVEPVKCNATNISMAIVQITSFFDSELPFNYIDWEESEYFPTPTIIEAAQALYRGHNVHDITRSDAGAENLTTTTSEINKIIEYSKQNHRKSICFISGVPGAGKTLIGLNIAIERSNTQEGEHAIFLSGNFPLVKVLQEALARDKVHHEKQAGYCISQKDALRDTSAFIQIIHKYRDYLIGKNEVPPEKVVIFDEAQRSWTQEKLASFMKSKKGVSLFEYSEPEFLISTMDRHQDWAVIVCLVGGGQEINTGEAGLPEWFDSLKRSFKNWDVYVTPQLNDEEYRRDRQWSDMLSSLNIYERRELHLSTSIRSFRTPDVSTFVKAMLDVNTENAKELRKRIREKYPIVITRDIKKAKKWIKEQCQGTIRCGLLASSGAIRLKPEGIFVKNEVDISHWFLNGKDDIRSSYALEDVVTEFAVQGLELDHSIVAWDADYRFSGSQWSCYCFKGTKWENIRSPERRLYLKNAYRVLLTRARQGMVIFVPLGSDSDITRLCEYYNKTYDYLRSLGIDEI